MILSRSFCNTEIVTDLADIKDVFERGVRDLRDHESRYAGVSREALEANRQEVVRRVNAIVEKRK